MKQKRKLRLPRKIKKAIKKDNPHIEFFDKDFITQIHYSLTLSL